MSEINRSSSILRDIFDDSFTGIHVDDAEMQNEIRDYLETIAPNKKSIVKLYENHLPIFEKFGIERQIKTSFGKTVSMQKGAYLVIEHTKPYTSLMLIAETDPIVLKIKKRLPWKSI